MTATTVPRKAIHTVSSAKEMVLANPANPVNWGGTVLPRNEMMLPKPVSNAAIPKPTSCHDAAKSATVMTVAMIATTRRRVHGGETERATARSSPLSDASDNGGRPPSSVTSYAVSARF